MDEWKVTLINLVSVNSQYDGLTVPSSSDNL